VTAMTDRIGATPSQPERPAAVPRRPSAGARPAQERDGGTPDAPAPGPARPAGAPDPTGVSGRLVDVFA
jgi:hypothetical protein